jgi:hypothetical protein
MMDQFPELTERSGAEFLFRNHQFGHTDVTHHGFKDTTLLLG